MEKVTSMTWHCPICRGQLERYEHGQGDYPWVCDPCGLGLHVMAESGGARSRRWDRAQARGIEEHWSLDACRPVQDA